jgi:hypothetical protein
MYTKKKPYETLELGTGAYIVQRCSEEKLVAVVRQPIRAGCIDVSAQSNTFPIDAMIPM